MPITRRLGGSASMTGCGLAKVDLLAGVQAPLEKGELGIAWGMRVAGTLVRELTDYGSAIERAGATGGGWSGGA
jgi:hypothetical protein